MNFFNLLLSKTSGGKIFDLSSFLYGNKIFGVSTPVAVRTELEIRNAGDLVSSTMGTKLNDGVAIYGIGYDTSMVSGTWYSGYLISKDRNAVLISTVERISTITYNNETWYYNVYRTTNNRSKYEDGIVIPYYAGKRDGQYAVTAILDYYFMKT